MIKRPSRAKNSLRAIFVCACCAMLGASALCDSAYGNGGAEGGGGDSGSTTANCTNNALYNLCGNPAGSGGGGASWRIFKANDAWGLDDWTGYGGSILKEQYKGQAMRECSGVGWFASYGWDGMHGSHYGYSDFNFQIGPANRNPGNSISSAGVKYNDYNAKDLTWLQANGFPNNTKIYNGTALELYRLLHPGATGIPSGVGYFCVAPNHTFTVRARVNGSGAFLENPISQNSYPHGSSPWAVSSGHEYDGYTFANWGIYDGTDGTPNDMQNVTNSSSNKVRDFQWKSLQSDVTVDAYYNRNSYAGRMKVLADGTRSVLIDSGWKQTDYNQETEIECTNDGCVAEFETRIGTAYGAGSTYYSMQRQENDGNWGFVSTSPFSPITPAGGDGTVINKAPGSFRETLRPGEKVCYRINFKPYGPYDNGYVATLQTCVKAKVSTFEGKSKVSGATSGDTGWQSTETSKNYFIRRCSSTEGCKVSFGHEMRRTSGIGASEWHVSLDSNLITSTKAIAVNPNVASGMFNPGASVGQNNRGSNVYSSGEYTLYPGMVVCEKLNFKPNNDTQNVASKVGVAACASALGDAQPPDNSGSDADDAAFLKIRVKNKYVSPYDTFQSEVYAKPGDSLVYRASYNPVLQYTYYLRPQKMKINGGATYSNTGASLSSGATLGAMFNLNRGSLGAWNNGFSVNSDHFRRDETTEDNHTYDYCNKWACKNSNKALYAVGNTTARHEDEEHEVSGAEVGEVKIRDPVTMREELYSELNEFARTNLNSTTQTTPSQVTFECDTGCTESSSNVGNVITTNKTGVATAYVPYNFDNSIDLLNDEESETLPAGETKTFEIRIRVNPKENNVTKGNYATIVRDARWKLEVCYTEDGVYRCLETTPTSTANDVGNTTIGNLNTGHNMNGTSEEKSIKINVPDLPAGTKVCVRSAVYPSSSDKAPGMAIGKNWSDREGSHTWAYSDPPGNGKCYKVAKKPSLQAWGGNIYTNGGIKAAASRKNNVKGYRNFAGLEAANNNKDVFSSWAELGVIAGGVVSDFSSGAGIGYAGNDNGTLQPKQSFYGGDGTTANYQGGGNNGMSGNPGGSTNGGFCMLSPLTFANSSGFANSCALGGLNGSSTTESANNDKSSIVNKFIVEDGFTNVNASDINLATPNDDYKQSNGAYYYRVSGGSRIGEQRVAKGTVQVVHANGNINIAGNLIYAEDGKYNSLQDIPKLVVYAKNINIECNVERIDALLVAEEEVKTCSSDLPDRSSREYSRQLIVNGAVVAGKLTPERTYGAATGYNSIIPAEILNFDPSLYLWGNNNADEVNNTNTNLDISSQKEMAPRL